MAAGLIVQVPPAKSSGKKKFKKKARKNRSTANKALSLAKQNRDMLNKTIENKQVNASQSEIFVSNGGYDANSLGVLIQPFLSQGVQDGDSTSSSNARVGNSITLLRTQVKFNFDVSATSETYNKFRVIVAESAEGAQTLTLSDILHNPTAPLCFSSQYTTKTSTNKRYNRKLDRVFEVNRNRNGSKQITLNINYGKTGRVVNYDGNSATPTDFKLSILAISDSSVAPHPTMSYTLRHIYKDA